jgi:Flp pilus assembly protein TadG
MIRSTTPSRRRRGAAVTEMAILLPLLSLLFLVAVDFCRVFYCTQTIRGCAEAGALYASGNATADPSVSLQDAASQAAMAEGTLLNPPLAAANVTVAVANGVATVTVSYNFRTIVGYPGLPQPLPVVRTAQMLVIPQAGQTN